MSIQANPCGMATLPNGVQMPRLGLGVWKTPPAETVLAIHTALSHGYRSFDTAAVYGNEREVGQAIASYFLPRQEIFVTTKVWNTEQGYDKTLRAYDASLERLGLTYVDLYLIHWPEKGKYLETWRALERLYEEKRVRAIGVSNFHRHHLEALLSACYIKPMVNQLEYHPLLTNQETFDFCLQNKIQFEAWSPLMRGNLQLLPLTDICKKYGKSPAQVVLRWDIQNGVITIPKSTHGERIKANMNIFDFALTIEEMGFLNGLNQGRRFGNDPDHFHFD